MSADFKPWEVVEFPWGIAVRHRKGKWETIILRNSGQEIDVSDVNIILHENGIEFVEYIGLTNG